MSTDGDPTVPFSAKSDAASETSLEPSPSPAVAHVPIRPASASPRYHTPRAALLVAPSSFPSPVGPTLIDARPASAEARQQRERALRASRRAVHSASQNDRQKAVLRDLKADYFDFQVAPQFYTQALATSRREQQQRRPRESSGFTIASTLTPTPSHRRAPSVDRDQQQGGGAAKHPRPRGGGGGPRSSDGRFVGYAARQCVSATCRAAPLSRTRRVSPRRGGSRTAMQMSPLNLSFESEPWAGPVATQCIGGRSQFRA